MNRMLEDCEDWNMQSLGARLRALRGQRGLTRKALAAMAKVSERHLASIEAGDGNASVLLLRQIALALNCPLAHIVGDDSASSVEWQRIQELLRGRPDEALAPARAAIGRLFAAPSPGSPRAARAASR